MHLRSRLGPWAPSGTRGRACTNWGQTPICALAPRVPFGRIRPGLRTLQCGDRSPAQPTCAIRRAPSPTPRACTSGARPTATVLYVGKAASLQKRVASYFASVNRDRKSEELVGAGRFDRADRRRQRERGAAARAAADQAPPAAAERAAARRQVVSVHRRDARGRVPARALHARAPPRRRPLLRPVRVGAEGADDARDAQQDLPVPALRGAGAGQALGRAVPRLPHRPLRSALRRADHARGLPRGDRRRHRVPRGAHEQDRARPRAAHAARPPSGISSRRPRAPATGSRPCATSASGRPWPSARAPTTRSRSRSRATSPTCSCSRCAVAASRSAARTTSRTPRSRARTRCSRASCSSTTTRRSASRRSSACTPRSPTPT